MRKIFIQIFYYIAGLFKDNKISERETKHWSTEMPTSINNVELEIKDDIIDIPECQTNLAKFKEGFLKNQFVSFIGAGTSHLTGIPQWQDLIGELCKLAGINFVKDSDDLYKKASEAKLALKAQNKLNVYYECLENKMKGISTHGVTFHTKVVDVFDKHITTNFDLKAYTHYIEKVSNSDCCQSIPNLDFDKFADGKKPFVFLHGHIGCKFVVFEKEIYDHYYPNVSNEWGSKEIELFLNKVCREFSIVFFGVSFSDEYLFKTFKKIAYDLAQDKDYKNIPPPHFLIVDKNALIAGTFNLIDLKKIEKIDFEAVKQKFISKGYVDDQGYFKIEKFHEFLDYVDSDQRVQTYLQDFGKKISDWFEKFQSMNVFPIIYKKDAHRFIDNILSAVSK